MLNERDTLMSKKHRLALFDFDGTITNRDTLWDFHRFVFGSTVFLSKLVFNVPVLSGHMLNIISSQEAKESFLTAFWKGKPAYELELSGAKYCERLDQIIRPQAVRAINFHSDNSDTMIIVTASIDEWVRPWALKNGIDNIIATKLDHKSNILSGKISGNNCNGEEKVRRIKEFINLADYDQIFVYGDSKGDRAMLRLGSHGCKFYKWRAF